MVVVSFVSFLKFTGMAARLQVKISLLSLCDLALGWHEAAGELGLLNTSLFCCVNQVVLMLTSSHLKKKPETSVSKQGTPRSLDSKEQR